MAELHWSLLAILASFFWGIVNLLDKSILSRYKLNPWDYLALDGFIALIPLIVIWAWLDDPTLMSTEAVALAMLSGIALAAFSIFYFYALQMSDVAIIVILIQTIPVFSLLWGTMLLGEEYQIINYIGMGAILFGVGLASLSEKRRKGNIIKQRWGTKTVVASLLMLAATFIMSIGFLVQDIALRDSSVLSVFFWQRLCLALISFFIPLVRKNELRKLTFTPIGLTSVVEVINLLGVLFIIAAYASGPLAGVSFLSSLQPVWVVGLIWILGSVRANMFPTDRNISRVQLIVSLIFVVVGLYFIQL